MHRKAVRKELTDVSKERFNKAWKMFQHAFFSGRTKASWRKFDNTDAFFRRITTNSTTVHAEVHFDTVLFVLQLSLKLLERDFRDFSDFKARLQTTFLSHGHQNPWRSPGFDATLVTVFSSGARKLTKFKKRSRERIPVSTPQVLMILLSLIPAGIESFGLHTAPEEFYFSALGVVCVILFLLDGLRGAELLAPKQKNLSRREKKKIPKFRYLYFYFSDEWVPRRLSELDSRRKQIKFLKRVTEDVAMFAILILRFTKPGRHRKIAIKHFHIFGSMVMCPLCMFAAYQTHRILHRSTPLRKQDYLFIFQGQHGKFFPITGPIFSLTLHKICEHTGLFRVNKSNFKIGVLTELWSASIQQVISFAPDARFLLQVADHRTDYHQNYLIPDLVMIATALQEVRVVNLAAFLNTLSKHEVSQLKLFLGTLLPFDSPPTPVTLPLQKANLDETELQSLLDKLKHKKGGRARILFCFASGGL